MRERERGREGERERDYKKTGKDSHRIIMWRVEGGMLLASHSTTRNTPPQ